MPRSQIGMSDKEKADARKISTVPSQSISNNAPRDYCRVSICKPSGDKGEKTCTEQEISATNHEDEGAGGR